MAVTYPFVYLACLVGTRPKALAAAGIINGIGSVGPILKEQLIPRLYKSFVQELGPVFILLMAVAAFGTLMMFLLWRMKRLKL